MHIVSTGENLLEMSEPVYCEKYEKYFKLSSAEFFTHHAWYI